MQGVFTIEELEKYSLNFLCGLYKTTFGNLNETANGVDIYFKSVSQSAYERPGLGFQAANEIIGELVQNGMIEAISTDTIRLTSRGLEKCRRVCR